MIRTLSLTILVVPALANAAGPAMQFDRDVKPILERSCLKCHNADKERGGLRLDDAKAALDGGNSGPVIVPGKSAASRLIRMVSAADEAERMPPKGPYLSPEEVGKLTAWIDQGAKWGDSTATVTAPVVSNHWAFQPVRRPTPPAVTNAAWARNDLDRFILARLEAEGVAPSSEADKPTLLRRLSLDLLGLPPTPEQLDEFLKDDSPGAYERLVDRLLASPHYGERYGRHWLDLARYADSDGFEKDSGRPFAWRWRDWVIDALNRDLPFDRFVIEQLAGDLLPGATLDQKIATGFHRNTLTNKEGGVDAEQFRVEQTIDRANTTGTVFLGLTVGCAQCHDHKYDPLSQKEYYRLFAYFNSVSEANISAPRPGEQEAYDKKKRELSKLVEAYKREQLAAAQAKWEASLKPAERDKLPAPVRDALAAEPDKRLDGQKKVIAEHYVKIDPKLVEMTKAHAAELAKVQPTQAQALADGPVRKTHVLIRGDFLRPGAEIQPGTPRVLPAPKDGVKTRLDLAKWVVGPDNPLTARVAVNRVWMYHFGRGLVATPEDFGTQGEKPSHPELLDWLASEFARLGWSQKALHKLIVTSATYRQSSAARPELASRDSLNVWLARQNRLRVEAEVVRDLALSASGLLNPKVGGPSVRPPQPPGISELTYANSARWVESKGADRYRRGLYTWFQRTSPYPMLMTFDAPDSNVTCTRRERSNTPLQALTVLNDTAFVECAQALGKRLAEAKGDAAGRVALGLRLCLGREPTPAEGERLAKLFGELHALAKAQPEAAAKLSGSHKPTGVDPAEAAAWVALGRALLNLDEFITRE